MRESSAELAVRTDTMSDLVAWAHAARQAHEIAVQLADTSFVPKAMYRRPGEVTGAILAGRELGIEPMAALRSIDIIDGTPAMRANALRGLVQSHGHLIWVEESTEFRAIVCGQRRERGMLGRREPVGRVEKSTWTMDRAKKANLAGKKNWQTHPTAMLVARATAEVCRLVAADVLLGMPYSAEELGDGAPEDAPGGSDAAPVAEPTTRKRRTVQRDPVTPAPPPPAGVDFDAPAPDERPRDACLEEGTAQVCPADDVVHAEVVSDDTSTAIETLEAAGFDVEVIDGDAPAAENEDRAHVPDMLTDAQRRRLGVEFRQADIADRAERLAYVARVIGREVTSSNELTKDEATRVIRALTTPDNNDGAWPAVRRPQNGGN